MQNPLTERLRLDYPIIQAGMVWTSGWKLAVACADAGILGLIGAGSMKSELLIEHIRNAKATEHAYRIGVNIPLIRGDVGALIKTTIDEGIEVVFTSAGNPAQHTKRLKDAGCFVAHVVASTRHAQKAEAAGCDAVVAEGFEAGGHNGVDEITTLSLIPQVVDAVNIPVIAAGGIADGRQMFAAMALGAQAVQIGTRFAASTEASSHNRFKQAIIESDDSSTVLALKKVAPVRLRKNAFALRALEAQNAGCSREEELELLGKKREMRGIFEGDLDEGELEMGQSSGLIQDILPAGFIIERLISEYNTTLARMQASGPLPQ
jgi:enoyl-[acyl-carrier protein] reductase II